MLEQHRIRYLPLESVSMQERVRAVEFVLDRCGIQPVASPHTEPRARSHRPQTIPPVPGIKASIESWPYALVDAGDNEA
jgi:hypothetical protein